MMAEKTADGVSLGNKDELIDLFWVYYPDARSSCKFCSFQQ